ncbi:hypothetical protein [Deinococcus ficus]|uniref:hypothetical protein n=1 Tax=Deinococcus ficus TaxID=317577 RepID=UPI001749CE21|nr:hypothetical protein [Deinococcus ficus]GHF82105.1 hypothetical protein GCM10017782_19840 [Deinococcus ficus]
MKRLTLLGALLAGAGLATTAPDLTLQQQARKADVIVRAVLGAATTVKDGDVTYTVIPLAEIKDAVAGDVARLPVHEGKPALFFLRGVDDLPTLGSGQEVFALLYAARADSPLVGFNQGLYPVVNGQVTWNSVTKARVDALAKAEADRQATQPAPATPTPAPTGTAAAGTGTSTGTGTTPPPTAGATPPASQPAPTPPAPTTPPASGTTAPGTAATPAQTGPATTPPVTPPAATPAVTSSSVPVLITDPVKFREALVAARGSQ